MANYNKIISSSLGNTLLYQSLHWFHLLPFATPPVSCLACCDEGPPPCSWSTEIMEPSGKSSNNSVCLKYMTWFQILVGKNPWIWQSHILRHTHFDKTYSTFCAKFMIMNVPCKFETTAFRKKGNPTKPVLTQSPWKAGTWGWSDLISWHHHWSFVSDGQVMCPVAPCYKTWSCKLHVGWNNKHATQIKNTTKVNHEVVL